MYKSEYQNIFENQESHWFYLGMRGIITTLLNKHLSKKRGLKILDAGCGTGVTFSYLKKYGDLTGIDLSKEALKYARRSSKAIKGNVTSLPFTDNTFDLIVCLDVLYHLWVPNYQKALLEFNRVLKPGGILIIREPALNWLKSSQDMINLTKRRFSKKMMEKSLTKNHFKVLQTTYALFFLFPIVFMKRLPEILRLKQPQIKSDLQRTSPIINLLLYQTLNLEALLIKYINLPIGSSIICLAKKYIINPNAKNN
jgi:ubiquinone/menaquinone biosynthesis C-methylase UbiE